LRVTAGLYRIPGQPYTFFISPTGIVEGVHPGPLTANELRGWLARLSPAH
jgi:hypothetical protein